VLRELSQGTGRKPSIHAVVTALCISQAPRAAALPVVN